MGFDALIEGAADLFAGGTADAAAGAAAGGLADAGATAGLAGAGAGAAGLGADAGIAGGLAGSGAAVADAGLGAEAAGLSDAAATAALPDAAATAGGLADAGGIGAAGAAGLGADAGLAGLSGVDATAALPDLAATSGAAGGAADIGAGAIGGGSIGAGGLSGADATAALPDLGGSAGDTSLSSAAGGASDFNDAAGTQSINGGPETQVSPNAEQVDANNVANGVTPTGNSSLDNALKQLGAVGKTAGQFAPLAALGLDAYGQHKAQGAAQQLNDIAKPVSAVENKLLGQYQSGQLNPADAYQINTWAQNQTNSVKQYYANAGLGNSSMEADALSNIQAQANAMRSQAVQNLLTGGLQAAGVAQGPQVAAVQASVAADQQLQQASSSFMQALAKMNAGGTTPSGG